MRDEGQDIEECPLVGIHFLQVDPFEDFHFFLFVVFCLLFVEPDAHVSLSSEDDDGVALRFDDGSFAFGLGGLLGLCADGGQYQAAGCEDSLCFHVNITVSG